MIILIALATIVATFLGGLFAVKFRDKLHLILGFSAGAVLGVVFFDLIPESIELVGEKYEIALATLLMATGFCVYLIFDRLFSFHGCEEKECENHSHSGSFGAMAFALHSFVDGLGVGLAFKISPEIGWIVAIAVLAHNFSDGINVVNIILKNRGQLKNAIAWLIFDALAPAIGIVSASVIVISGSSLGLLLSLFAGSFLYIGASDLIPESHHRHPTVWTSISTILGLLVLFFATRLAG
ncbi:MAG: zinc/iron permease [Candidatus Berkelbacteria bacterium Athens1014_28]|uniref:Zinc/iron permease n=1 Tax=Candidatus Berkelbacteria bacterium Athens1014_28 TaxID=2017145 RepID=A0A554LJD6_9BACT|nr:MAG: zinc/iron permease [Candidatus Berkelbacteria bacterium Athens1014_28]